MQLWNIEKFWQDNRELALFLLYLIPLADDWETKSLLLCSRLQKCRPSWKDKASSKLYEQQQYSRRLPAISKLLLTDQEQQGPETIEKTGTTGRVGRRKGQGCIWAGSLTAQTRWVLKTHSKPAPAWYSRAAIILVSCLLKITKEYGPLCKPTSKPLYQAR